MWKDTKYFQSSNVLFDLHFDVVVFLYFTKINNPLVYFHYKNIYTLRSFFSFHTTWIHCNNAVQQAVPLIATHINDKALIMINATATVSANKLIPEFIQFVCTHRRSHKTTSIHCLNIKRNKNCFKTKFILLTQIPKNEFNKTCIVFAINNK